MKNKHLPYLDGIRALCAIYVVVYHETLQFKNYQHTNILIVMLNQVFKYGHFAVVIFIVISGYCLMLPVLNNNGRLKGGLNNFIKRRALRILPTYYVAMAVSLILIFTVIGNKTGTHWDVSIPVNSSNIISHILMLQYYYNIDSAKINHTFWSISVEWQIYFLFPILIWLIRGYGIKISLLLSIAFSLSIWVLLEKFTNFYLHSASVHFIILFMFGIISAKLIAENNITLIRKNINSSIIIIALITVIFCAMLLINSVDRDFIIKDLMIGAVCSIFIYFLSIGKLNKLEYFLSLYPLTYIGTFAYSIYLIHAPLIQLVQQYITAPLHMSIESSFLFIIFFGTPSILGISFLFYKLAEKPFLKKKYI